MEGPNKTNSAQINTPEKGGIQKTHQEKKEGAERLVYGMFEGVGIEAKGRIIEKPTFENPSSGDFK